MHTAEMTAVPGTLRLLHSAPGLANDQGVNAGALQLHADLEYTCEAQARVVSRHWAGTEQALSWFDAADGLGAVGH